VSHRPAKDPSRLQALVAGAPGWVGGVLTGLQAAVLGLLVVVGPAFAAAAAAPTSNGSATIDWMAIAALSTRLWLLGHGAPLAYGETEITLIPLGLTLICAAILAAVARRFCTKSWASWGIATGTYVGTVASAQMVSMRGFPDLPAYVVRVALIAALVAAPAVAAGIWRAHGAEFGWVPRIAPYLRRGLRLGVATSAAVVGAGALIGAGFTVLGRGRIADAVESLGIDPLGGTVLAFGQALYTPNISVWMVGWMSGQGFVVGEGSLYAPGTITSDALPAFPLFGALPHMAGGLLIWVPAAVVVIAVVARLALSRRIDSHWRDLDATGVAAAVVAATMAFVGAAATGALGPGRLSQAGIEVLPVVATVTALAALGFVVGHGIAWGADWMRRRRQVVLSVVPPAGASAALASGADQG
jgi:hypothetical protein